MQYPIKYGDLDWLIYRSITESTNDIKNNKNEIWTRDLTLISPKTLFLYPNELIHIFKRKCHKNQYDNKKIWAKFMVPHLTKVTNLFDL
jgi:hypothetical protein